MKFAQKIKFKTVTCPLCKGKREIYSGNEWHRNNSFYCHFCKRCVGEEKNSFFDISPKGKYLSLKKEVRKR